jgi:PhnB protein
MSRIQLSPYINFQGRAREAMEFYRKVLGGKLDVQAGPGGRVGHARLEADGAILVGSDGHPDYPPTVGDNMAVALAGTDRDRLTRLFTALGEGGMIKGPLAEQPGGGRVGYLLDQFGINWIVTIENA